jgi:hypothetical protein
MSSAPVLTPDAQSRPRHRESAVATPDVTEPGGVSSFSRQPQSGIKIGCADVRGVARAGARADGLGRIGDVPGGDDLRREAMRAVGRWQPDAPRTLVLRGLDGAHDVCAHQELELGRESVRYVQPHRRNHGHGQM